MTTTPYILDFPADLVRAVAAEAERDADAVGMFLTALGLHATPDRPIPLPAGFLLDLGAALRLLAWHEAGLPPQEVAGLPPARQALTEVFLAWKHPPTQTEPAVVPGSLAYRVCQAFVDHFAWSGRDELDADVTLGEADEDAVLEALADFLWAHRPR
jgi:hypothetical protein